MYTYYKEQRESFNLDPDSQVLLKGISTLKIDHCNPLLFQSSEALWIVYGAIILYYLCIVYSYNGRNEDVHITVLRKCMFPLKAIEHILMIRFFFEILPVLIHSDIDWTLWCFHEIILDGRETTKILLNHWPTIQP